ncbi:MAG TPA: hypothetical protein VFY41_10005 [Nitrososphaeraceae archaeon]|nr:hypothetical protein [Nitrososphaeraceae archaeon]
MMINNDDEGYSKLKHDIKENVKAVLSEKRVLISISFAAVIQTLKADPEMVKLIQNIPSANDGKQHEDSNDNNNITKYLESNKDRMLDLAGKQYENLLEALTNDYITNASSNTTLSSPQSSSPTFPNLSDQNDAYRMKTKKFMIIAKAILLINLITAAYIYPGNTYQSMLYRLH